MMNKLAYTSIINNAQRSTTGRRNAVIPLELITADPLYQRVEGRNESKLKKLFNEWDYNLMDALMVVPHPEEYMFYVVDGLGRLTVARERGDIEEIDCVIITGPENPEERRVFEAKYFLRQAACTEKVSPLQKHNALLLVGDKPAIDVEELTRHFNIEIKNKKGQRSSRVLGSYDSTYNIARSNGREILQKIFKTLFYAGYMDEANGLNSRTMVALANIYKAFDVSPMLLAKYLRPIDPNRLYAKSLAKYEGRGWRVTLTLFLQDFIIEELGIAPRFDTNGKLIKAA